MALLLDQWLRIQYRKRGATVSVPFEVQPLGLVTRGPMLYLICRFRGYTNERTIALSRFDHVELLPERFKRPDEFSLEDFVEKGRMGYGDSKLLIVKLRFDRHRGEQLFETPLSPDQEIVEDGNNFLQVTATIPITPQLKMWLLGFGAEVEVLEPASLRRDVIQAIRAMKKKYEDVQ